MAKIEEFTGYNPHRPSPTPLRVSLDMALVTAVCEYEDGANTKTEIYVGEVPEPIVVNESYEDVVAKWKG